jgi:hypothetical protein
MSFILRKALAAEDPASKINELLQKGGLYHKGVDMAQTLAGKIANGEPYYPPIFPLGNDEGITQGFLDHLGVTEFDQLPNSSLLCGRIGAVALVTVERISQLRPHELGVVGSQLPAVRVLFVEHGQSIS